MRKLKLLLAKILLAEYVEELQKIIIGKNNEIENWKKAYKDIQTQFHYLNTIKRSYKK